MYSVVTWQIDEGPHDPITIQTAALAALGHRQTCDLYSGVRMVRVASGTDFTLLHEALQPVENQYTGQFRYAVWALRDRSPMRTEGFDYDQHAADEVRGV